MPVDGLGHTASLIAALRAELGAKIERTSRKETTSTQCTSSGSKAASRNPEALHRELAALVCNVSPNDAKALNAVRPRVIRSVLLWEFGAELREYSDWRPMIEHITQTLERNAQHREDFSRMVRDIQRLFSTDRSPR